MKCLGIWQGRFAKDLPHLLGINSDEGTSSAVGIVNTTDQLRNYLLHATCFQFTDETVSRILELYPDDPTQGVRIYL